MEQRIYDSVTQRSKQKLPQSQPALQSEKSASPGMKKHRKVAQGQVTTNRACPGELKGTKTKRHDTPQRMSRRCQAQSQPAQWQWRPSPPLPPCSRGERNDPPPRNQSPLPLLLLLFPGTATVGRSNTRWRNSGRILALRSARESTP